MTRIAVKIAYVGNDFFGSQIQPNVKSVEETVLSNLKLICQKTEEELDLHFASRTDRGVNALGNVIVFNTNFEDFEILLKALNAISKDIFYRSVAIVDNDFNHRHATQRLYRYIVPSENLDIRKMKMCAELFVGEHDFNKFCKSEGRLTKTTIDEINIWTSDNMIIIDFAAKYYLWNMIRRIVAAITSVGRGYSNNSDIERALNNEEITFGLARPDGLTLLDIHYDCIEFISPDNEMFDRRVKEELFTYYLKKIFFSSL